MAAASVASDSPSTRAASAVELAATLFGPGQLPGQELLALGQGVRVGRHLLRSLEGGARPGHQVQVDVHHHLALDEEVDVEDEPVDGGADRALDGVLDRDEAEVDLPLPPPPRGRR